MENGPLKGRSQLKETVGVRGTVFTCQSLPVRGSPENPPSNKIPGLITDDLIIIPICLLIRRILWRRMEESEK